MYRKLYEVLEQKHISRYKLAKLADIDFSSLYSALAGKRELYPNWRKRISNALAMPESELFPESVASDRKEVD